MKRTCTALFFIITTINISFCFDLKQPKIDELILHQPVSFCKDTTPTVLTFDQLKPLLTTQSDSVIIINFWATWCAPCVSELPYFEELTAELKGKKAKVILVSLDFKAQIKTKLLPFLKKKRLLSEVVVLVEKNPNAWIPKVNPEWSGSIPATLIFDKNKRQFYEQSFDRYEDLKKVLSAFSLNNN